MHTFFYISVAYKGTGTNEPAIALFHLPAPYVLDLFEKDLPVSPESEHSGKTHILQRLLVSHHHA